MKKIALFSLFLTLSMGCTLYRTARKEVLPCVGNCVVQSGPKLMLALWEDVKAILGGPTGFLEGLFGEKDVEVDEP